MSGSETLNFNWNDFHPVFHENLNEMRENGDFFDVTLTCDSDVSVKAHKVILASCSGFFKAHLRGLSEEKHPLIYLRGVKREILTKVVDFLYKGEVSVDIDDLKSLLDVAKDLDIIGLSEVNPSNVAKRLEQRNKNRAAVPIKRERIEDQARSEEEVPAEYVEGDQGHDEVVETEKEDGERQQQQQQQPEQRKHEDKKSK